MKPVRIKSIVLALALPLAAIGFASAQTLNPVVTVLSRPTSAVPDECEQGLTTARAPRIQPEEVKAATPKPPPATVMQPPPAATLRGGLREIQDAAERGDRDAFGDALARVHALVATYPTGGERNAANDVLKVYDDLQQVWDYQFQSPTGAFFDASTDNLLASMKPYADYQRFIADKTITDANGARFYPTRETRDFLVREAASRLKRAGVPVAVATKPAATPTVSANPTTTTTKTKIVERAATHHPPAGAPRVHRPKVVSKPGAVAVARPKVAKPTKVAAKT
ncbi:MAG: hypothetical protein ACXV5L_06690, partial [Thermoanaerobaculia bacterium]